MLTGRQIQSAIEAEFGPLAEVEFVELTESNAGLCLECGHWQSGVEPDARKHRCEVCGAAAVYGAEELLFRVEFSF